MQGKGKAVAADNLMASGRRAGGEVFMYSLLTSAPGGGYRSVAGPSRSASGNGPPVPIE